jgi:hypothetical protein
MASLMIQDISKFALGAFPAVLCLRAGSLEMLLVEGKSPCGQVDLLLRDRLLTIKTEDA